MPRDIVTPLNSGNDFVRASLVILRKIASDNVPLGLGADVDVTFLAGRVPRMYSTVESGREIIHEDRLTIFIGKQVAATSLAKVVFE
jgi:hypothetical protein